MTTAKERVLSRYRAVCKRDRVGNVLPYEVRVGDRIVGLGNSAKDAWERAEMKLNSTSWANVAGARMARKPWRGQTDGVGRFCGTCFRAMDNARRRVGDGQVAA